jgi:hypothetical protein
MSIVSSALMTALMTVLMTLSLAVAAAAQEPAKATAAVPATRGATAPVDVDQLPVDLSRIQRKLAKSADRQENDGLNLKFFIAVYAQAPQIRLYTQQDNLSSGPVPYGAPTHSQMMNQVTPQEYRAPAADFTSIMRWLSDKAKK